MNGTSRHLTWFDQLGADGSYATLLGIDRLASSHAINDSLGVSSSGGGSGSVSFCSSCFIWQLKQSMPSIFILGLDRTVLHINDVARRHGVQPTDKVSSIAVNVGSAGG